MVVVGFPYMFIRLITEARPKKKASDKMVWGGLFFRTVSLNGGCLTEKHCKILHTESQWAGERGKNEVWK